MFCPTDLFLLDVCGQNGDGFLSAKLEDLLKLMIEVLPSCHFSAKRHRLDCLYSLIVHVSKVISYLIDSICCTRHVMIIIMNKVGFGITSIFD